MEIIYAANEATAKKEPELDGSVRLDVGLHTGKSRIRDARIPIRLRPVRLKAFIGDTVYLFHLTE